MSAMLGSGLERAPDGFQAGGLVPFGSAPGSGMLESASGAAFINDNIQQTMKHSTNNEGIQQTIKRAPFFVAQEEAKGTIMLQKQEHSLSLNNNLHTNIELTPMLKNPNELETLCLKHYA